MDIDAIWFELQHFKNERSWYNLNLGRDCIVPLLLDARWYKLFIPPEELEFTRFDRVRRWEEIAVALLKKYADRYYKHRKQEWESDFYEYHELREDDPNFVSEYRLLIDESQDAIVEKLGELKEKIENGIAGRLVLRQPTRHLIRPAPLPAAPALQERLRGCQPGLAERRREGVRYRSSHVL